MQLHELHEFQGYIYSGPLGGGGGVEIKDGKNLEGGILEIAGEKGRKPICRIPIYVEL